MTKSTDSLPKLPDQDNRADAKSIREALLELRQIARNLPPVDAAAIVREIRDQRSGTS